MTLEKKLKLALESKDLSKIHSVFENIYITYGKLVYFKLMQYIDNKQDVEELTQDVFVQFYNHLSKISSIICNIKYYLLSSAKNKAIDFLKSKKVKVILDENIIAEQISETNPSLEYQEILDKMKLVLDEFEIDLILKHNLDNISFKELFIKYDKPLNTILSIYHRALRKLKKKGEITK